MIVANPIPLIVVDLHSITCVFPILAIYTNIFELLQSYKDDSVDINCYAVQLFDQLTFEKVNSKA